MTSVSPIRIPDAASLEAVLARLDPVSADADIVPVLGTSYPGFAFSLAHVDDDYWRNSRSVLRSDGTNLGELRPWMTAELAKDNGDLAALWRRLKATDLQLSEWRGTSVFLFAPTGPGAGDYIQIALDREIEWRAGPIVNPDNRPWSEDEVYDPTWIARDAPSSSEQLSGPVYRLRGRAGGAIVHVRSFLRRCARLDRDGREARRSEMERRVIREVTTDGTRETPFLEAAPGWFDQAPREVRFFQDWEESSAAASRVFTHWALDIRDYEHRGEREIGFIPRPLRVPGERLTVSDGTSVHILMDRVETIDRDIGLPFGWFFLMVHGNWVDPAVGDAIAEGLKADRVRLPQRDAAVLLRWAEQTYGF